MSDEAHVAEARAMLEDYEDLSAEERVGALKHAISALQSARREVNSR